MFRGSYGKESACNAGDWGSILVLKDPPEKRMEPTPEFSPGEFHGQRRLAGCSPWGHKELDMTERLTLFFAAEMWNVFLTKNM